MNLDLITRHAKERNAERVHGVDPSSLDLRTMRDEIAAVVAHSVALVAASGMARGEWRIKVGGFRYVLQDQHVVTILPGESRRDARLRRHCRKKLARELV